MPMVRDGDTWREVTWDEAFARCEELHPRRARAPRHRGGHRVHRQPRRPQLLARPLHAAVHRPVGHAAHLLGGHRRPVAEERRRACSCTGTCGRSRRPTSSAPTTGSSWAATRRRRAASLLACPDVLGEIDAHPRSAAARSSSIDPRRTGTADHADEWVPILPGTDAAFLLAMCNVLFAEGLVDARRRSPRWSTASTTCATSCAEFTPESVEAFCRVPAETIRRLAREIAAAPTARRLRPHRAVQPGVRHARVVARRRGEHRHRQLRPSRRADVRQPDRVADGVDGVDRAWTAGRAFGRWTSRVSRRARGARPGAGLVPRRGDRHAGRRADQGAHHHRRQPGDQRARRGAPRGGAARARVHDQRRQLPQRDDALRARDPARAVAARDAALRRAALGLGRAQRRQLERPGLPAVGRPARRVGDPRPARLAVRRQARTTTSTSRRSTTAGSPRSCRSQGLDAADVIAAATTDGGPERMHRPARSAPARGATATARCPTG